MLIYYVPESNLCVKILMFLGEYLFYVVWRTGTKPILTPYNGRRQISLSGIRTCDHPHATPELYHCATDADIFNILLILGHSTGRSISDFSVTDCLL